MKLNHKDLLNDYRRFKQSGGASDSEASTFDMPNHSWFRLLWHFNGSSQGLLHPSWIWQNNPTFMDLWDYSSAYNYLLQNGEETRAAYLKAFIELLSTINSESPWYFQTVKGIEDAIQRKQREEMQWKELYTITIECLEDSVDQRIGTLLDLYRAVVWSWERRVEILPVNLRRFDMSVIVFSSAINGLHINQKPSLTQAMGAVSKWLHLDSKDYASLNPGEGYTTSYKQYDLINCEIDYKSTSGAADGLNNTEGSQQKYTITITFTDIRERRHNEFSGTYIDDVVDEDLIPFGDNPVKTIKQYNPEYESRLARLHPSIPEQLWGAGAAFASRKIDAIVLGNLYGLSITKIADQIGEALDGNVEKTYANIKDYIKPEAKYLEGYNVGVKSLRDS